MQSSKTVDDHPVRLGGMLACFTFVNIALIPHAARRQVSPRATIAATHKEFAWGEWADAHGLVAPKILVRQPTADERGKGGVIAVEHIRATETIARIPRNLVIAADAAIDAAAAAKDPSWATVLTGAALSTLHSDPEHPGKAWIEQWESGGWATNSSDLGPEGVRWGASDVTGSLLATGSDNDKNIYAKFRFPCHPVVHRAGLGLAALTRADKTAALDALVCRGSAFRTMREALSPLVATPTPRRLGSVRERASWDVADMLSKVLSRATELQIAGPPDDGSPTCAIVPLHERLAHCDARGENCKCLGCDPRDDVNGASTVLLVATRDIEPGEEITRDYTLAPRLPGDQSDGALRLLLQFGLPPKAWPSVPTLGAGGANAAAEQD